MRGERGARGLAVAGDDVQDTVGQTGLAEDLLQLQRGERRLLGGLENRAAPRSECGRNLEHRDEKRPVPRDDEADDTDGLELGEGVVGLPGAEQAIGDEIGRLAVNLADPAGVVLQHVHRHRDDVTRGGRVHAVVLGFECGELLGTFLDDSRGAEEDVGAVRSGALRHTPTRRSRGPGLPLRRRPPGRNRGPPRSAPRSTG